MNARQKIKAILEDPETFATVLVALIIDRYGTEAFQWDQATTLLELADDFGAELPQANQAKLFCAEALFNSDDFFKRLPMFIPYCNVLAGSPVTGFDIADAAECAWGVTEALLLVGVDPQDPEPFSDEIRHYIGAILDKEGIREPPDVLRIALRDTKTGDANYADMPTRDPEMFAATFETQQERTNDITAMLKESLQLLVRQLESLPLENGDARKVFQRRATTKT